MFNLKKGNVHALKEYSITGNLLGTTEYVIIEGDTVMQGKFLRFNEKGIKISEGQFVDNEPHGICKYYYHNGKLEAVQYRQNSKITLESTYYSRNGFIEKYVVYDDLGIPSFIITYDEIGGVVKYDGYVQFRNDLSPKEQFKIKKSQDLKVGNTLKYSYTLANIPNASRNYKIENISVDNSKVKRTLKHIPPAKIDVEEVLTKKGKNTIRSIVRYEFKDKITPVYVDTLTFDVNVN